jgi:hypothetical protein
VLAFPRDWTAAALGLGTTVGMTVAAAWMLTTLARVSAGTLRGVGTSALAAGAAGVVAAGGGRVVSVVLPSSGVGASVGATVIVGACCTGIFALVASRLDPATMTLLVRRVRRAV